MTDSFRELNYKGMISIILPVYNAEKTLNRCLESIVSQSFRNWELVVVDDGSTDRSTEIIESFMAQNKRIVLYRKKNGGVGSARNYGLKEAKGEYLTFVDGDDWLDRDYLDKLYASAHSYDLVLSYPKKIIDSTVSVSEHNQFFVSRENFARLFTDGNLQFNTSPWAKLYRTEIVRQYGVLFDEKMRIGEDALFLFEYILHSSTVNVINYSGYCYYFTSEGSLTKRVNNIDNELYCYHKIYDVLDVFSSIVDHKTPEFESSIGWLQGYYSRRVMNTLYHMDSNIKDRLDIIRTIDYIKYVKYLRSDSVKEKCLQFVLKHRMFYAYDMLRIIAQRIR